jgi:hypothetical protein
MRPNNASVEDPNRRSGTSKCQTRPFHRAAPSCGQACRHEKPSRPSSGQGRARTGSDARDAVLDTDKMAAQLFLDAQASTKPYCTFALSADGLLALGWAGCADPSTYISLTFILLLVRFLVREACSILVNREILFASVLAKMPSVLLCSKLWL